MVKDSTYAAIEKFKECMSKLGYQDSEYDKRTVWQMIFGSSTRSGRDFYVFDAGSTGIHIHLSTTCQEKLDRIQPIIDSIKKTYDVPIHLILCDTEEIPLYG